MFSYCSGQVESGSFIIPAQKLIIIFYIRWINKLINIFFWKLMNTQQYCCLNSKEFRWSALWRLRRCLHSILFILMETDIEHRGSEFHSTGTYIIQDCEGFSQRLTQQPDPFSKQLVQMFTEMLTDNNTGGKQTVITKSTWFDPHKFIMSV